MNITRRKARAPIAALGAAALMAGWAGFSAGAAFGAGTTLAFAPTSTSATVVDVDPRSSTGAPLAYGVKITGMSSSDTRPLMLSVLSGPTGGEVHVEKADANEAPSANAAGTGVTTTAGNVAVTAAGTAGSASVTLSAVPHDTGTTNGYSLAGHVIKIGDEWSYVSAHTSGTTAVTLDRPLLGTHTTSATATLGTLGASPDSFLPVAVETTERVWDYSASAADNIFFGATDPGTYTLRLFLDTNSDGEYSAATDDSTPTFTLNVKDVTAATSSTSDDLDFAMSAPSSVVKGLTVTATATPVITLEDTRGTSSGKGVLGSAFGALLDIDFTGPAGAGAGGDVTFTGTAFTRATGTITAAGSLVSQPQLDLATDYEPTSQAVTTTVTSNNVTAVALVADEVTGTVIHSAAATVNVKAGTASVTYEATVTDTDADKSGNVVYFTLGGADVASLTTNGTTVDADAHIFSATTNASGVASLTVTSTATVAADTYTVSVQTNNVNSVPPTITTTYVDRAATEIEITNTAAELTPSVGDSVTIEGRLLDQFGVAFQPGSSSSQQVTVGIDPNDSTYDTAVVSGFGTLSGGEFTFAYTPSSAPTAGQTDSFRLTYGAVTEDGAINWASTTAAASVTLTTPNDEATGINLSDSALLDPGQAAGATDFGSVQGEVTGTVRDASNNLLAFKSVTITGSAGVYFSEANTGAELTTSVTAVTDGSGAFDGVFAYFTKSGTVSVTATSGAASDMATMTTDNSDDPYAVTVDDVSGMPGETLIVTGTVNDAFGNAVPGTTVDLSTGTSTIGVLGDIAPETNAAGVFKTTYLSGSNQSGTATLTATLDGMTANPTAHADWENVAELTVADGDYEASSTITVTELELTLSATGEIEGYEDTELSGHYKAGATVDIYAKPHGESSYNLVDSVSTDSDGNYGTSIRVTKITSWLARAGSLSSEVQTTIVRSKVTLKAKAMGNGVVQLTMNGDPNAERKTTFYMVGKGGKLIPLRTVWTNEKGMARIYYKFNKKSAKTFRAYYAAAHTRVGFGQATVTVT